ncbi:MAG: hypothetical protein ACRD2L_23515 [Terriglobia bacterium]
MQRRLILQAMLTQRVPMGEGEGAGAPATGAQGGAGGSGEGGAPLAAPPAPPAEPEMYSKDYVEKLRKECAENRVGRKTAEEEAKALKAEKLSDVEKKDLRIKELEGENLTLKQAKRQADIERMLQKAGATSDNSELLAVHCPTDCPDIQVWVDDQKKNRGHLFKPTSAPPPPRTTSGQAAGATDAGLGRDINAAIRNAARG